MHINTYGIVIKAINIGERDKLLTIITSDYGKISVYAKGANSLKSKLASSSNLFAYSKLVLFNNRSKYSLDNTELIEIFYNLRNDIKKLSLAQYFAELMGVLAVENTNCKELLSFFLNTLYLLTTKDKHLNLIKSVFELKALSYAGYMPDLEGCHNCDANENLFFCIKDGFLLCGQCNNGLPLECVSLSNGILSAMKYILSSMDGKVFSFTLDEESLNLMSIIVEKYLLLQLEHKFSTLDFYSKL